MTSPGMYDGHHVAMDLIELARSIQADREREIASTMQRRRWLGQRQDTPLDTTPADRLARRLTRVGQSVPSTRSTR